VVVCAVARADTNEVVDNGRLARTTAVDTGYTECIHAAAPVCNAGTLAGLCCRLTDAAVDEATTRLAVALADRIERTMSIFRAAVAKDSIVVLLPCLCLA